MDLGQCREVVEWTAVWEEEEAGNPLVDRNPRNPYRRYRVHWRYRSRRPRKIRWRTLHTRFRKCQGVWGASVVGEDGDWEEVRRVVAVQEVVGTGVENMEDTEATVVASMAAEAREVAGVVEGGREEGDREARVEEGDAEGGVAAWEEEGGEEAVPAWHPCT